MDDYASYYSAALAATVPDSEIRLGVGTEVFGEHFRTPLATVHKFNGWADKFAARSVGLAGGLNRGLRDHYLEAGYKIPVGKGLTVKLVYHWFEPEEGGGEGGTELDLLAAYEINKYLSVIGKYGEYDADNDATGSFAGDKRMFTLDLNFIY